MFHLCMFARLKSIKLDSWLHSPRKSSVKLIIVWITLQKKVSLSFLRGSLLSTPESDLNS